MGRKLNVPFEKYVNITNETDRGLVEFDFAVGDPTMYVELALPKKQFNEFCENNKVNFLTDEQLLAVANDKYKWKYGVLGTRTEVPDEDDEYEDEDISGE